MGATLAFSSWDVTGIDDDGETIPDSPLVNLRYTYTRQTSSTAILTMTQSGESETLYLTFTSATLATFYNDDVYLGRRLTGKFQITSGGLPEGLSLENPHTVAVGSTTSGSMVSGANDTYYYRVTATSGGTMRIEVSVSTKQVYIDVFDGNLNRVTGSTANATLSFDSPVSPGTAYTVSISKIRLADALTFTVKASMLTTGNAPQVTASPESVTIGSGKTATLSVVASGAGLSYQWYRGNKGDTTNPVGTNSSSFTTPALTATTSYWVRVSNTAGSADSQTATVMVSTTVTLGITNQPQDTTISSGQTAVLSVTATGSALSYQWYRGAKSDTAHPVGTNSASFTTPALTATTSYWVRVTSNGNSVDSSAATVTVSGSNASFSNFSDTFDSLDTSRWEKAGGNWSVAGGKLTGTWSTSDAQSDQGNLLLLGSPVPANYTISFVATLGNSNNVGFALYRSAGNKYNIGLDNANVGLERRQGGANYTSVTSSTFSGISAGTSVTVSLTRSGSTFSVAVNSTQVLSFTDSIWAGDLRVGLRVYGTAVYDSFALSTTPSTPAPTITASPAGTTIDSGKTATLSVSASGSGLSYQWYRGTKGDTSAPVGTSAASFTTPALTATTSYWVRVSNSGGNADSETATVTVSALRGADLRLDTIVFTPTPITAGDRATTFGFKAANIGDKRFDNTSQSFTSKLYLSRDQVLDSGDILLVSTTWNNGWVDPGYVLDGTVDPSDLPTIPAGTAAGDYYLVMTITVPSSHPTPDVNGANNTASLPIRVVGSPAGSKVEDVDGVEVWRATGANNAQSSANFRVWRAGKNNMVFNDSSMLPLGSGFDYVADGQPSVPGQPYTYFVRNCARSFATNEYVEPLGGKATITLSVPSRVSPGQACTIIVACAYDQGTGYNSSYSFNVELQNDNAVGSPTPSAATAFGLPMTATVQSGQVRLFVQNLTLPDDYFDGVNGDADLYLVQRTSSTYLTTTKTATLFVKKDDAPSAAPTGVRASTEVTAAVSVYFNPPLGGTFSKFSTGVNGVAVTTPTVTLKKPAALTASGFDSGGNVTADGGSGVTARGVCWNTAGNPTVGDSKTSDGSGTGSFDSAARGLASATKYFVSAYAMNSAGAGYSAATPVLTRPAPVAADAPDGITGTGFTAHWQQAAGVVSGYRLFVATDADLNQPVSGFNPRQIVGAAVTSFSVTGLTAGRTYYYRVYAYNDSGQSESAPTFSVPSQVGTPVLSVITGTRVRLNWPAVDGAQGYQIEWSANGQTVVWDYGLTQEADFPPAGTGSMPRNVLSTWRVRAYGVGGEGLFSVPISYTQVAEATSMIGYYSGTFGGGAGEWTLSVGDDGTGYFVAYFPDRASAVVSKVSVNADGTFLVNGSELVGSGSDEDRQALFVGGGRPTQRAAGANFSLSGRIDASGSVSAQLSGIERTLSGTREQMTVHGAFQAGFYQAPMSGSTGTVYVMVGADGKALVVAASPAGIERAFGAVQSDGRLTATTNAGATLTLAVDAEQQMVSGSLQPAGGALRSFSGLSAAAQARVRLSNIATRAYCSSGNRVTIGGFVVAGSAAKRVLVRAVGASLTAQGIGVGEVLADPMIEVHDASHGNVVVATNDNLSDNANASEITAVGAQLGASGLLASDTKSSALLLNLTPGVYSFVVTGKNASSGIVLLEVYDADTGAVTSRFSNIATRAYATTGNGVTIGGFVVAGSGEKKVLLRAVGPTLSEQGLDVAEVLADPMIELHDASHGNGVIAINDNWQQNANAGDIRTAGARIGATPFGSADVKSAALLLSLPPGVYSFIVSGKSGASGVVLVEVYDAD